MRLAFRFFLSCLLVGSALASQAAELLVSNFGGNNVARFDSTSGTFLGNLTGGTLQGPLASRIGPDGLLYVCSETNNTIQRFNLTTNAYVDTIISGAGLNGPTAITWTSGGSVLVCNFTNSSVSKYSSAGAFQGTLVASGSGGMNGPDVGATIGPDGLLYVPSFFSHEVIRYNATTGAYVDTFIPANSGGLTQPRTILFRDNKVWVSSDNGNKVLRYNLDGSFLDTFVPAGSGTLNGASGMAFGDDGILYVTSWRNNRVNKYSLSNGAYLGAITTNLNGPVFITIVQKTPPSPGEGLYVSSSTTNSIKRYSAAGAYLGDFVTPGSGGLGNPQGITFGPDGNLYVSSPATQNVLRYNGQTGAFMGAFTTGSVIPFPGDLTFRPDGFLYVSDFSATGSVKRFNAVTGAFVNNFVTGVNRPDGQAWDTAGNLYLSCFGTNQVKKYNTSGTFVSNFATTGLNGPTELRFGADGHLYVNSYNTGVVKRYNGTTGAFMNDLVTGVGQNVGQVIGPDGLLYVGSQTLDTVRRYNAGNGSLVDTFASGGGLANPTNFCFKPEWNSLLVAQSVPSAMVAGQTYTLTFNFQNAGTTLWSSGGETFLRSLSPMDNSLWGVTRQFLGTRETIEPGRVKQWRFSVVAPETSGTYDLQFGMGQGAVGNFGVPSTSVPVVVTKANNAARYVSQVPPPATLVAGSAVNVSITYKNVGNFTWTPGGKYYLGSRNPVDNYYWGTNRIAMANGASCAPGENYTFTRTLTAPWAAGTYTYQWKPVHTSGWFGDFSAPVTVTVTPTANAATYVSQTGIPSTIAPGGTFTASITMKNTGTVTWTAATGFRLGSSNPVNNTLWGMNRVEMPAGSSIAPNGQVTFTQTFTAPSTPGTYYFQWRMIKTGVAFFGETSRAVKVIVQ